MSGQQQKRVLAVLAFLVIVAGGAFFLLSGSSNDEQSQVLTELDELVENSGSQDSAQSESEPEPTETDAVTSTSVEAVTSTSEDAAEPETTASDTSASVAEDAETTTSESNAAETTSSAVPDSTDAPAVSDADTTTSQTSTSEAGESEAASEETTSTRSSTTTTESTTTTVAKTTTTTTTTATTAAPPAGIPRVASFEVIETLPHDTDAFTQGLEISNGRLFESTGLFDESSIRELDLSNGNVLRNTSVPTVFAEGLTIVGDSAIQLTWKAGEAYRYDLDTFEIQETFTYSGEGWGLCLASGGSGNLVMSDGSSELEFRDPDTFASLGSVDVTLDGAPIESLNELECVGDTVWANIWQSSLIIEIDPNTGDVLTVFDADELRPSSTDGDAGAVWNGIAFDPSDGTYLVTGKRWPLIYRIAIN